MIILPKIDNPDARSGTSVAADRIWTSRSRETVGTAMSLRSSSLRLPGLGGDVEGSETT
jgi:hypothetical protein